MSWLRVALVFSVVAIVAGACIALFAPRPEAIDAPMTWKDGTITELRESMRGLIRAEGGIDAYASFKARYASASFDTAHNAAHLFGESLYDVEGVGGVAACDAGFNFGCYHGFFAVAVAKEGLDVVSALDAACGTSEVAHSSACQHGIGHGILEYLGHDKLVPALEACGLTDQPDPLAGCTSGVFMEYNVPLVVNADGSFTITTRQYAPDEGPYTPCGDIPERFRGSCLQELPQWWQQVFHDDFAKMGALCAALDSTVATQICIAGVGKIVPSSADYSVEGTERFCALMPADWYDKCITQAAWSFETNILSHAQALEICRFASKEAQKECPQ
jgi:hypothetical protein